MFAARDTLLLLLSWHRPLETMLALVTYCCVCLSPGLLLLAPCTVLLHWMTLTHEKRASTPARDVSSPKPTGTFPLPFTSSFFLPMDEASPEYLKNLQNLQNMMGEMSDLYDAVYARVHHFDWSSETEATRLFQGLLLVTAGVACVVALVPFRYLALGGGVSLFIANTRFVKYIVKQMMPQVLVIGQLHLESVMANYEALEQQLENQMAVVEVSLYEHQKTQEAGGDGSVVSCGCVVCVCVCVYVCMC
ncbi:hypothetical protein BDF14DRAFT_1734008 [Spinellus fusiger]|nr:hypothetical protein BDF14DRAFT_1734008 [Spinellus fusiger]